MHRITGLAVVLIVFFACSKGSKQNEVGHQEMGAHGVSADWKFTLSKGDPSEGRKVFVEVECYKCHEVKGEKFPALAEGQKGVGPELSQMAGMHPPEFFTESIINPNAVIDLDAKKLGYVGKTESPKCRTTIVFSPSNKLRIWLPI
jgi:Cytochrome c